MLDPRESRGTVPSVVTLVDALAVYAQEYRTTRRASSAKRAIETCTSFVQFVGSTVEPRSLTRDHVRMFRDHRAATCSPATVTSDLGRIRAWVNFMRSEDPPLLSHDPTFKVPPPAPGDEEDRERGMSDDEEAVIVNALAGHELYLDFVTLGLCVGWRPGEGAHALARHYDPSHRRLSIASYPGWKLKTPESRRTLEVTAEAHAILARRKLAAGHPDALLFSTRKGTPFKLDPLRRQIQRKLPEGTRFSLYALRHRFAAKCVIAGWSVGQLKLYMGHAQISTTQTYFRGTDTAKIGAPPVSAAKPATAQA